MIGDHIPKPHALLFDLDGTLVDTVENRIRAWLETFRELQIPADRGRVAKLIGADGKRVAREVAGYAGLQLDDATAEKMDRRSGEIYAGMNTDPRPLPGARELIASLRQHDLRWAIATSSRAEQVMRSVDALALPETPVIIDGSQVRHAKPEPDLMLAAARRLATPPLRCWCVGDATWDMRAAVAAGMVGIGVATGVVSREALEEAGAAASFKSLSELARALEQVLARRDHGE